MIDDFKQRGNKHGRLLYFSYNELKKISKSPLLCPPGPIMFESTRRTRRIVYPILKTQKCVSIEKIDIESFKGAECVAITKKGIRIAEKRINEITNGLSIIEPQIQQRLGYQDDRKLDENFEKECQSYGLNWLRADYFEFHKSTETDFDNWKKGFPVDLSFIKAKRELRREALS